MAEETSGRETISIMADFGMGPYAWHRGGCIADATSEFPPEFGVSKGLEAEFAEWIIDFERNYEKPTFDWEAFHRLGVGLSRKLKREIGDRFNVEYHKPVEDPAYDGDRKGWVKGRVILIKD